MNANSVLTKDYEDICPCGAAKNKPNSKPISQKVEIDASSLITKDYKEKRG
jgi:hypothetical protein